MEISKFVKTSTGQVMALTGAGIALLAAFNAGRFPVFYSAIGAGWVVAAIIGYRRVM